MPGTTPDRHKLSTCGVRNAEHGALALTVWEEGRGWGSLSSGRLKTGEQSDEATCQEAGSWGGVRAPPPPVPPGAALGLREAAGTWLGCRGNLCPSHSSFCPTSRSRSGVFSKTWTNSVTSNLSPPQDVSGWGSCLGWSYLPGQEPEKPLQRFGPISEKLMKTTLPW